MEAPQFDGISYSAKETTYLKKITLKRKDLAT
jgi:hypothetical protein